jgi:hypothetical protein
LIYRDVLLSNGMYPPREGDVSELGALTSSKSWWQAPPLEKQGSYAVRVCTEEQMYRLAVSACELALCRQSTGYPGIVTLGAKYSIMFLSGAMMLAYFGYAEQAKKLERAIEQTYRVGVSLTLDQGGRGSTMEFTEAVAESILKGI